MKPNIDLLVVGAGSGGLAAAKAAADLGAKVVVVEADRVGGCCVQRGCVPKKIMVYAAQMGAKAHLARALGWAHPTEPKAPGGHSWAQLTGVRDQMVGNLELAHQRHLAQRNIAVKVGRARLKAPHVVEVAGEMVHADTVLWASGSVPVAAPFPGAHHCLNSDDFFRLDRRPQQAVIIGGGYIACEFASLLQALGTEVTLVVRRRLLSTFDEMVQQEVLAGLTRVGVNVWLDTTIESVSPTSTPGYSQVHAHTPGGPPRQLSPQPCMLAAIGRRPHTALQGLQEAGVVLSANGAIEVDTAHHTGVPGLFAVGDVIDRVNLTPSAIRAGRAFAQARFGGGAPPVDYDAIPKAVFTNPQVGAVGLTQQEATQRLGAADVAVFASRFVPLVYSVVPEHERAFALTKLVVQRSSDKVVGCHIVADEAPEIIQGFAAAMQAGITKRQLDATGAVHPTSAEEMVLMRTPQPAGGLAG